MTKEAAAAPEATTAPEKILTTLGGMIETKPALDRVAKLLDERATMKLRYSVSKLVKKVTKEVKIFGEEQEKLLQQLGVSKDGMNYEIAPANRKLYTDKIKELLELPVTINWAPLDLTTLEPFGVTASDIAALDLFVVAPKDWD